MSWLATGGVVPLHWEQEDPVVPPAARSGRAPTTRQARGPGSVPSCQYRECCYYTVTQRGLQCPKLPEGGVPSLYCEQEGPAVPRRQQGALATTVKKRALQLL